MGEKLYSQGLRYNPDLLRVGATQHSVNQLGAVHLIYRGQRYLLKDGVINVNLVGKPVVLVDWKPSTQYDNGVMNLNLLDAD